MCDPVCTSSCIHPWNYLVGHSLPLVHHCKLAPCSRTFLVRLTLAQSLVVPPLLKSPSTRCPFGPWDSLSSPSFCHWFQPCKMLPSTPPLRILYWSIVCAHLLLCPIFNPKHSSVWGLLPLYPLSLKIWLGLENFCKPDDQNSSVLEHTGVHGSEN